MISEKKRQELLKRMEELHILEKDLEEKFLAGSGKGGQKINKTSSAVYLKHQPSGTEVKCQKHRNREDNRFFARRLLCEKLEHQLLGKKSPSELKKEKIRKQKKRRERRTKSAEDFTDS